jgi:hypothetical protein
MRTREGEVWEEGLEVEIEGVWKTIRCVWGSREWKRFEIVLN